MKRGLLLFQQIIGIYGSLQLFRIQREELQKLMKVGFLKSLTLPGIFLVGLGYSVGFLANIFGYGNLSNYLTRSFTFCLVALFLFFVLMQMIKGLFTLVFFGKLSQSSNIIKNHKEGLFKWFKSLTLIIILIIWTRVVMAEFGFQDFLSDQLNVTLSKKWVFGQVTVTIQNFIDGVLVMIFAWYLGIGARYLLQDEILPRLSNKRGLPAAVGISVRYFIISVGFILAVASLGLDLDKLGFIAGALSVGIGFGLQNVVGNFISGLILLFERPVVPGDIVSLQNIEGKVLEIGLRSSRVKTWEGAEVIIPNMDLISKSVTNLTLSDSKRRIEKIVQTEKDADPKLILDKLNATIITHPELLADPAVQVLYKGQEANYYQFRILYWVTGNVLSVGSEINLMIDKTLDELNVRVAIPENRVSISGNTQIKDTSR
jgi:small-conductance mechanosensitive channel